MKTRELPLVSVAVPVPGLNLLTYAVGSDGRLPAVGARVVVPLGSRIVTGVVVGADVPHAAADPAAIKPIRDVLDDGALK